MSESASAEAPVTVLAEATWYVRAGHAPHRTALLLAETITLHGVKALIAGLHLGDPARADEVKIPYLSLVYEPDLPGTGGASVIDPATGRIRITSRACHRCPFTGAGPAPAGFADALAQTTAHQGHHVCPATTAPHARPANAAICRAFATESWQHSIALHLAATNGIDSEDPPPASR
jgi:hypothetical protein